MFTTTIHYVATEHAITAMLTPEEVRDTEDYRIFPNSLTFQHHLITEGMPSDVWLIFNYEGDMFEFQKTYELDPDDVFRITEMFNKGTFPRSMMVGDIITTTINGSTLSYQCLDTGWARI